MWVRVSHITHMSESHPTHACCTSLIWIGVARMLPTHPDWNMCMCMCMRMCMCMCMRMKKQIKLSHTLDDHHGTGENIFKLRDIYRDEFITTHPWVSLFTHINQRCEWVILRTTTSDTFTMYNPLIISGQISALQCASYSYTKWNMQSVYMLFIHNK